MYVAGGCAKHDMVKNEEPFAPVTQAATAIKTVSTETESASNQPIKQAMVKESVVQDMLKPIANAGELKINLEKIYFDFDAHSLSKMARDALMRNVEIMKNDPNLSVQIEGHCDERGSDEYNLALGDRRAKVAMQYMVTMGIPEKRFTIISYGKEKPVSVGHDEPSWAKNRRDEFVIWGE
jgi:peptidoglycan-associated lipoprotein